MLDRVGSSIKENQEETSGDASFVVQTIILFVDKVALPPGQKSVSIQTENIVGTVSLSASLKQALFQFIFNILNERSGYPLIKLLTPPQ